jgi:hypothetical protein
MGDPGGAPGGLAKEVVAQPEAIVERMEKNLEK